jgi:thioredoxin-dependent peroxiredoxin
MASKRAETVGQSGKKNQARATAKVAPAAKAAPKPTVNAAKAKAAAKAVPKPAVNAAKAKAAVKAAPKPAEKPAVKAPKPAAKPAKAEPAAKAASKPAAKPARSTTLTEGGTVPAFSLPDQSGRIVTAESLRGRPYVLYFYPKDDTPGCTREACGFRDDLGKFDALGVRVVGVSPDKSETHARFAKKYGLSFTLLADVEKRLANAAGVWVMKQNYGREYMGIERSTFLVGADGKVLKAWRGVKVDGHVAAVHAAATASPR